MRILVVEDEAAIAESVSRALGGAGFAVDIVDNGEDAWFSGDTEDYDAVVLDLGLPQLDGLTVLKRWREAGRLMPIIVLTARGRWKERVEGINAGADDYLPKPFEMEELLARVRAVLRRSAGQPSAITTIGEMVIDTNLRRVQVSGETIDVSPLEYRLLMYLVHARGKIVSQHELTEHLYAQDFERQSNAVEVLIGRLRRKLGIQLIETRRGFGYTISGADTGTAP
jgi:two-component system, OmpR family, response regulator